MLRVNRQEVCSRKVDRPFRFLFISDLHFAWYMRWWMIGWKKRVLYLEHKHKPFDLIVFGGDYTDSNGKYLADMEDFLSFLRAWKIPMVGVLGDHEATNRYPKNNPKQLDPILTTTRDFLEKRGVNVLVNAAIRFVTFAAQLEVIGLRELETSIDYQPDLTCVLAQHIYRESAKKLNWYSNLVMTGSYRRFRILVCHNPDGVFLPGGIRPDLVLAGHTHGGQIPGIIPLVQRLTGKFIPRGSWRNWAGRTEIDGSTLIISKGFGCSGLPLRFGCVPEVVAVEILPQSN